MPDAMPDARTRHAATQRRHAARLRARGVPRGDDIARALLKGARLCLAERRTADDPVDWKRLVLLTIALLVKRGFDTDAAAQRLRRALGLPDPGAK